MHRPLKKYIPVFSLIVMILLSWLEESIITEGKWAYYFNSNDHMLLRSNLRLLVVSIIFVLGMIGLNIFPFKWVRNLWLFWYLVVFITVSICKLPIILLHHPLPLPIWKFFATFYGAALTPVPYVFIWLLAVIEKRRRGSFQ